MNYNCTWYIYMTDKLGHRSAAKGMGVLAYNRLKVSQECALAEERPSVSQADLKEAQHCSFSKTLSTVLGPPKQQRHTGKLELQGGRGLGGVWG